MEHGMGSKSGPCRTPTGLRQIFEALIGPVGWQGPCRLTSETKHKSRSFRPLIGCCPGRVAERASPNATMWSETTAPMRHNLGTPTVHALINTVASSGRWSRYSAATFGTKQSVISCDGAGALVATRSAARLRRYSLAGLPHHTVYGSRTSPFMRKESASSTE